jgi:hypothetical protein
MSEPEKISVPDANDNSGAAENELEAAGLVSAKAEAASDVEALPQPKQRERVPRSQRRGILGNMAIIPEITNPYEYSNGMKWLFTALVALAGTTSSTGSSILYRKYMKL